MKMNIYISALILLFGIFLIGCPAPTADNGDNPANGDEPVEVDTSGTPDGPVRVAFVPSVEMGEIEQQLDSFETRLGELLGHEVEAAIVLSYSACIEQMAAGHFEAAFLPSLAYVLANDRYGTRVVLKAVRDGRATYKGQILVRTDSGIDTLEDLVGRTMGFVDATSTSGHLYPKTLLMANGIDPDEDLAEYTFIGSHPAVVQAVLQGRIDAGATYDDARLRLVDTEPTVMEDLKVIAYTPGIPADTVSLRGDLEGEFWDGFIEAMMEMSVEGEEGSLYIVYEIDELVPGVDEDYDPIREMVQMLEMDLASEVENL